MKRWIASGVVVTFLAGAGAAEPTPAPVSVYPPSPKTLPVIPPAAAPTATLPGTVVPMPTATTRPVVQQVTPDVTKPLSSVLDATPSMPVAAPATAVAGDCGCTSGSCGAPLFPRWRLPKLSLGLGGGSYPCLERLRCWLAWKPGPRVMPACTPTPYQPPLRHYFTTTPAMNLNTAPAGCTTTERAPFFGPRLLNIGNGRGCKDGGCGNGSKRCDGCHEGVVEKAVGCLTPRQFGRAQPNCWGAPGAPAVSACASSHCDHHAGAGGVYPGLGGGYRFASPVLVPPAPAIVASPAGGVAPAAPAATPVAPAAAPAVTVAPAAPAGK